MNLLREPTSDEKKRLQIKAGIIIFIGVFFAVFSFYIYQIFFSDNLQINKPDKPLYIRTGATFEEVADSLMQGGYVHDRLSFMFLSKLTGYREHVQPGRYLITTNMNNYALFKKLNNGRQDPLKLTIVNVRTMTDLALKISNKLEISYQSVLDTLIRPDVAQRYGFNDTTFIAMFLPDTYEIYWTWQMPQILSMFQKQYLNFWNQERREKAQAIKLTPKEVIIMASIVQAETNIDDEKPRIAGVYMNRYNGKKRLQADPTLIFATQDFSAKRVTEYHRYFKSPFNTYRKIGLPPGPINIPSISSIEAVLNYEKHEYYFFCAAPDLSGKHLFSKTFDDHLQVAQTYWKSLDKANIH
ncbi:MAG: endolytic transglycosylase MltG [Cytophagales bacterium]|nr:endolytic transglycosylase MltG [Cytophagales bacterium]